MPLFELTDVRKRYTLPGSPEGRVALDGVSLTIDRGELIAVHGTSGSGKSTLLNILGALDRDFQGQARLDGQDLRALSDADAAQLRQRMLGFVFQAFHLIPGWTVRHNVALPASFSREPLRDIDRRVDEVLARVGLEGRAGDPPSTLSGGQRQRVAIARALLLKAPVLLCDEPTGSLDTATGETILQLFRSLHRDEGLTVVLVTHEERVTAIASRVLRLESGKLASDARQEAS
ncbi:MAG: ABC transporter ATP-binding protein [Deltaproteobacteria bacterium]|nr:ABC transporter ATP-binding protein [Deltaproteobacteria bacterium]